MSNLGMPRTTARALLILLPHASYPIKKTIAINIPKKDHHDKNNSNNHGHGIFVTPYARSLEG